jgi:hypothetical protein
MFRQIRQTYTAALAALAGFTLAAATGCGEHPPASASTSASTTASIPQDTAKAVAGSGGKEVPESGGEKHITNSIGMKLTLVPAGEFMMGNGEPAKEWVAFFQKTDTSSPRPWGNSSSTPSDFTTCTAMPGNGARITQTRATTPNRPLMTHRARTTDMRVPCGEVPGRICLTRPVPQCATAKCRTMGSSTQDSALSGLNRV